MSTKSSDHGVSAQTGFERSPSRTHAVAGKAGAASTPLLLSPRVHTSVLTRRHQYERGGGGNDSAEYIVSTHHVTSAIFLFREVFGGLLVWLFRRWCGGVRGMMTLRLRGRVTVRALRARAVQRTGPARHALRERQPLQDSRVPLRCVLLRLLPLLLRCRRARG